MMETKRCTKCCQVRPLDAFFADKRAVDGLCSSCKQCRHLRQRVAMRRYRQTDTVKRKDRARARVSHALRTGQLVRATACTECGKTDCAIEGHHDDYGQPLSVAWLCRPCHRMRHAQERRR